LLIEFWVKIGMDFGIALSHSITGHKANSSELFHFTGRCSMPTRKTRHCSMWTMKAILGRPMDRWYSLFEWNTLHNGSVLTWSTHGFRR
jgi:hypothetical protein